MLELNLTGLTEESAELKSSKGGKKGGGLMQQLIWSEVRPTLACSVPLNLFVTIPYVIGKLIEGKILVSRKVNGDDPVPHYSMEKDNVKVSFAHSTFWHNTKKMLLATGFTKNGTKYRRTKVDIEGIKLAISQGAKLDVLIKAGILSQEDAKGIK